MTTCENAGGWVPGNTFANRLVLVRRELGGVSVKAAAARCHLNYATWSTWENGRTPANFAAAVEAIAAGLGVDRDWLMWGETSTPAGRPVELPEPDPDTTSPADPERAAGELRRWIGMTRAARRLAG